MNYYERYCGDYARDTALLSLVEHGAYTVMLDAYYSTEQALPAPYVDLYRLCRAMTSPERAGVRAVADQFFPVAEDGLRHNTRADKDLAKALKRINAARENGKLGAPDSPPSGPPGGGTSSPHMVKPPDPRPHTPKVKSKTPPAAPAGIRPEVWAKWVRWKGKKLTADAVELQTSQLAEFAAQGDDPNDVIEQSIANGWAGLFPISRTKGNGHTPTLQEKRAANMDDLCGRTRNERTIDAGAVDRPPVRPALSDLRQPDDDDVGGLPKGGHH